MNKRLLNEMEELENQVINMAELSKDMLKRSVIALKDLDVGLAEEINEYKCDLQQMDVDIEEEALRILTLFQPMATDMRFIACVMKLISYLFRIGRYGKDIANIAIELKGEKHVAQLVSIPRMAELVCDMIDNSILAFNDRQPELLTQLYKSEKEVDALRYSIFRECLTYMMEDPKNITRCTHYIMVARYLERCGDHACKMAEKIHYFIKGEHIDIDGIGSGSNISNNE